MNPIQLFHVINKNIRLYFACLALSVIQLVHMDAKAAILGVSPETAAPVHAAQGTAPLVLLTVARDHTLSFPAYNDMSDLNGDGVIDYRFNNKFTYLGLFNSNYCYTYLRTANINNDYFTPSARANPINDIAANPGGCLQTSPRTLWSGNWLNYMTTSRLDAMRVALYGGYREKDDVTGVEPRTILRRAYIPQDGHAWGKQYETSVATIGGLKNLYYSGYTLSNYAPFDDPGKDGVTQLYHLFGNLTSTVDPDGTFDLGQSFTGTPASWRDNIIFKPLLAAENGGITGEVTSTVDDVGRSCFNLNICSQNYPPLLRVVEKSGNPVWRWASSERPVLDYHPYPIGFVAGNPGNQRGNKVGFGNLGNSTTSYTTRVPVLTDYAVRVAVCIPGYRDGCKAYTPSAGITHYKPTGVLQDYGDNDSVKFGLMTGSYDNNLSGGRIRKNIQSFVDNEVLSDGRFNTAANTLVKQLSNIRIRNFNNPVDTAQNATRTAFTIPNYANRYFSYNFLYKNNIADSKIITNGNFGDWGNPIAEMMFEGLRYFAGGPSLSVGKDVGAASKLKTPDFNSIPAGAASATVEDGAVGLDNPNWDDPYSDTSKWCAKPNLVVVSGPNPSFDSDQLPGSFFDTTFTVKLKNDNDVELNAGNLTKSIGIVEGIQDTSRFIGERWGSAAEIDRNPTLKSSVSLDKVRGLIPDETDNQGSFLSAGVAHWAKTAPLRKVGGKKIPTVDTYAMVLNSPYPSIKIPFPGTNRKTITIIPFAKTLGDNNATYNNQLQDWQFTNQIVGVYPTLQNNPENVNPAVNGNFRFTFVVNFEDRTWGGDFEMDFVVEYDIEMVGNELKVRLTPTATGGSASQNAGYYISGTTNDGAYIEVQSSAVQPNYFLNTPPGRSPGYCKTGYLNWQNNCDLSSALNVQVERTHTAATVGAGGAADTELKNPLWYAARWGGYPDDDPPTAPLSPGEDPKNYVQVNSPANLKLAFQQMIQSILDNTATVGTVTSSSGELGAFSTIFTSTYNLGQLTGDLSATKYSVTPSASSSVVKYAIPVSASSKLPASYTSRNILFSRVNGGPLYPFNKVNLQASLVSPGPNLFSFFDSDDVVNYIAGDQSKEIFRGGTLRTRASLIGTIINAVASYSQDTGDVYVGANDGMLHAFNADTMEERFAFIPKSLITKETSSGSTRSVLNLLSDPTFTKRYFVDGDIGISDSGLKDSDLNGDYKYLIAFLGRGGRGYFGMKIDNSTKLPASAWESALNDSDIGYLTGKPLIEQLSDGTSVAIFGNGYDSVNNKAVLYVVRLLDGQVIAKYQTVGDAATPNGLATPGVVRKNGRAVFAYAGDYQGNVWKFALPADRNSVVTRTYGGPGDNFIGKLFRATDGVGNAQPIVAPITTAFSYDSVDDNVKNKQFVFFGTGSNLTATSTDLNSTQAQSLYGLIDPLPDSTAYTAGQTISKGNLRVRSLFTSTATYAGYSAGSVNVRAASIATSGDMAGMSGWMMDWFYQSSGLAANRPSEKVFSAATVRPSVIPTLVVSSNIASSSSCVSDGAGYLNAFDAYHGGSLSVADTYFDINRNGLADEKFFISGADRAVTSIDFGIGAIGQAGFTGNNVIVQGAGPKPSGSANNFADVGTRPATVVSRRTSWREITN